MSALICQERSHEGLATYYLDFRTFRILRIVLDSFNGSPTRFALASVQTEPRK